MKPYLTEMQYIQLAKEAFSKVVRQIPFVSDIEFEDFKSQNRYEDIYARISFVDSYKKQDFYIVVKSNGEKRFANLFMKHVMENTDSSCYLFVAPYISEATSEMFQENNRSFMDLSGNCFIVTSRYYIHVCGKPNKYLEKRSQRNYFSRSSSAVSVILRTMLNDPNKLWKVKELSVITGKALGTVSNVKSFLSDRDFIEDHEYSFRLRNIKELLYLWSSDYHKKETIEKQYYSLDSIPELEVKISKWSSAHENKAVLTGFSAAARYAPTVRYNKINVYVEGRSIVNFVKDLNLNLVQSGGNIVISIPHDETPCLYTNAIDDSIVASPVQTIIDLLGMPNRGEEAADAIILRKFLR